MFQLSILDSDVVYRSISFVLDYKQLRKINAVTVILAAACYLPAVRGRCSNPVTKWHFDSESNSCRQFEYGGCVGNDNNFDTERDCQQFCLSDATELGMYEKNKVMRKLLQIFSSV